MKKSIRLTVLLGLLLVTAAAGLTGLHNRLLAPETAQSGAWSTLPYKSEDQWIVSQTARAVLDMAHFAVHAAPLRAEEIAVRSVTRVSPPRLPLQFAVSFGARDVDLQIDSYVWDPETYVGVARAVGVTPTTTETAEPLDVATPLLELTAASLQAHNDLVSRALARDFSNAAHHEAAAFTLVAFAFREAAGIFYDPRFVMCRASAHLAMARALRADDAPLSVTGRLADAVLQVLAGRTGPAQSLLDALDREQQASAVRSWVRAARLRSTRDWREPVRDAAPLVERLEYMRALTAVLSADAGLTYLETHTLEDIPDWGWRIFDTRMTVAAGHLVVAPTIARTFMEADAILHIWPDKNRRTALTRALTREPAASAVSRGPEIVRVIDDGLWSAFYQRELVHVASGAHWFYHDKLGSPGAAASVNDDLDGLMRDVPLWVALQRLHASTAVEYATTMPRLVRLLESRPDLVSYTAWHEAVTDRPEGARLIDAPSVNGWFNTLYPTGTTFDPQRLIWHRLMMPVDFVRNADAIHQLAPWDVNITRSWSAIQCNKGCTPEQQKDHLRLVRDYNTHVMKVLAYEGSDSEQRLKQICALSGDDCYLLAEWFVSQDRFAEAEQAYERYIEKARDRVGVSNRIEWLVRHYQRTRRQDEARRVAEAAADVGSFAGWRALAGYHERRGRHDLALELYRRMYRRYDNGIDLLAHLMRRGTLGSGAQDGPEYVTLTQRYFDGPPTRFAPSAGHPSRGLIISHPTNWLKKVGVRAGDIIVAVDGYAVRTADQFSVMYFRSFDASTRLTMWRDNRHVDLETPIRRYYFDIPFKPFAAPERPAH